MHKLDWKKYLYSFGITAIIFVTAIFLSNYFGQKKLDELRTIQDKIAIDILSSETQFSLLEESSCQNFQSGALSTELGTLEDKLAYTENQRGAKDPEVVTLKRYYFLLEIKDYILMNRISAKCKKNPVAILYFYSTDENCADCEKEGYVLDNLRQTYPDLRVYSFDYNTDVSAVKTLISINKVKNTLPAIVTNNTTYYGFQTIEDLEKVMPELQTIQTKTNNASTKLQK
jgi:hypothetical protein